ncbi:MAG: helix-turn-helix transcriptional regulator, partial [Saprospiraceae bacterium]|nr:helix-turn-helix transcriptional regulator [Saprospiraceae bacterium]
KSAGTEISEREVEVLRLISQGLTNQEIAEKLFLSFHTADSHRRNLVEKLGAKNTADLVRIGLERGYI